MASNFIWYELMTPDAAGAEAFYKAAVGWTAEPFPGSEMSYTLLQAAGQAVAGIMPTPPHLGGMPPFWSGYIHAADVDAATESLRAAGGTVHRAPQDIPGVGRFSVVADPQGAMFQLMAPQGPDQPPVPPGTQGHVGWHELYANDAEAAMAFYGAQFGWTAGEVMDMGEMGPYRLYEVDGEMAGGMMDRPPQVPVPGWLFYFTVDAIDAAAARVAAAGGKILFGPMEVPGGSFILQALDPQGALFALTGPRV